MTDALGAARGITPVSVLLPVFNGGAHLAEAVESILSQTHTELELLIVDDGSTDGTADYLASLEDPRVRVLTQANAGLVASLNRGLAEARYEYVARMDSDDVSLPERLERQVAHLQAHPTVAAVGSCFEVVDESGTRSGTVHAAAAPAYLRRQLYFRNVLPHGGMALRRSAVLAVGGYREVGPVEDYDLWTRLVESHEVACLPDLLFRYRVNPAGISQQAAARQVECLALARRSFHARTPMPAVSARSVLREGVEHVAQFGATCQGTAQWYAFDHAWLALLLARQSRWAASLRITVGVALFCLRRPRAVLGLPPVMTARAWLRGAGLPV